MTGEDRISVILEKAEGLTAVELVQLVNLLWQRLEEDPKYYPEWHKQSVEAGIAEMDGNPQAGRTPEESIEYIRAELERRRAIRK